MHKLIACCGYISLVAVCVPFVDMLSLLKSDTAEVSEVAEVEESIESSWMWNRSAMLTVNELVSPKG